MKCFATVFMILFAQPILAQSTFETIETQFGIFINRPSVKWAAYVIDSLRFSKPNLSAILVKRVQKNEIKASLMLSTGTIEANHIRYVSRSELESRLYPSCSLRLYDSSGNILGDSTVLAKPYSGIDRLSKDLFYAPKILFVEGGKLNCYVPYVAPAFSLKVSSGGFICFSPYFSTAFNFQYNYASSSKNRIIKLGTHTLRMKVDSVPAGDRLKELYGKNMLWALLPAMKTGAIKTFETSTGKLIQPHHLDDFVVPSAKCYDIYDAEGVIGQKCRNNNPLLFYITDVDIIQEWFYDYTKNKVVCKIRELLLYVGRDDDNVLCTPGAPELKLVF